MLIAQIATTPVHLPNEAHPISAIKSPGANEMRKKGKGVGIEARGSAKIEAVAKASYSRKRTITEVIPPDVTRAKTGAWLDLISPLTEWAGLKGDQLRAKRMQLRLQREDALSEIVARARAEISAASKPTKTIPNKFLIPFSNRPLWRSPTALSSTCGPPSSLKMKSRLLDARGVDTWSSDEEPSKCTRWLSRSSTSRPNECLRLNAYSNPPMDFEKPVTTKRSLRIIASSTKGQTKVAGHDWDTESSVPYSIRNAPLLLFIQNGCSTNRVCTHKCEEKFPLLNTDSLLSLGFANQQDCK